MTGRRFATLDVFTDRPLTGNPLAVVLDADGLDARAMQALAREFNLSETVFVLPPARSRHRARLRIFTPATELPFAGHPTLGTAILLALEDRRAGGESGRADALAFGLEEEIGTVPCVVSGLGGPDGEAGRARFRLPALPRFDGDAEPRRLADLLGLPPDAIGLPGHAPSGHTAGPRFTFVPVADRAALDAARLDAGAFERARAEDGLGALYLYAPDPSAAGHGFHARMFAPHFGIAEDPATGSAAAAFAGVLARSGRFGEGTHDIAIRQGEAMGRPSRIDLQIVIEAGALRAVEIGGEAVVVGRGVLHV